MFKKLRIGTRNSKLAIRQTEEIINLYKERYPEIIFDIKKYKTSGDYDKTIPLAEVNRQNFFTDTIEEALLKNEIEIAVHSAKDLPDIIPSGLVISAVTKAIDPYDVLVSKNNLKLDELPKGAKIGTSSKLRKEQLKKYRSDLEIIDIRGNIEERLFTLYNSDMDGIVIAAAGFIRLGLEKRITQRISFDILKPHPLQGSLAIEVKKDNMELVNLTNSIDAREKILFVCSEYSYISQMAETIINHLYWPRFFAYTASSKQYGSINFFALKVMKEKGVDISVQGIKSFDDIQGINFDYIITIGYNEVCPYYPTVKRISWDISYPKVEKIEFFRRICEEIENKIREGLFSRGEK